MGRAQFTLDARTDNGVYSAGEPIEISLVASNYTSDSISVTFPDPCPAQYRFDRFDTKDWIGCITVPWHITVAPAKAIVWSWTHDPKILGWPDGADNGRWIDVYLEDMGSARVHFYGRGYTGGTIQIQRAAGVTSDDLSSLRDSLSATILSLSDSVEDWKIVRVHPDSAVAALSGDARLRSIERVIIPPEVRYEVVNAEDMRVLRSSPMDGDSAVALNTTISFDFTLPLDTTARFSRDLPVEFFAISPPDSIQIDSVYYDESLTTMYLDMRHTDDTDFLWIMTGARSPMDTLFCAPYVLGYSTAENRGSWKVTGEAYALVPVKTAYCWYLMPLLFNRLPTDGGYPVGADVTGYENEYVFEIDGVRDGTYWPALGADTDGNGVINEAAYELEFYPWSGQPESIDVAGADVTGVTLEIGFPGGTEGDASDATPSGSLYPNPAHREVTVAFEVESPVRASIDVVDLLGRKVQTLADGFYYPGPHELTFDASSLPAGVYFVRLRVGDRVEIRSLVVGR